MIWKTERKVKKETKLSVMMNWSKFWTNCSFIFELFTVWIFTAAVNILMKMKCQIGTVLDKNQSNYSSANLVMSFFKEIPKSHI